RGMAAQRTWPGSPVSGLGRDATVLLLVLAAGNASSYVFHLLMARMLGPPQYGALSALLGILVVLGVPAGAIQAVVARRVALLCGDRAGLGLGVLLRSMLRLAVVGAVATTGLVAATAPWSAQFLRLDGPTSTLLLAPLAGLSLLGPVGRGVLQGQMRFGLLGGVLAGGMLLRLAVAPLLVAAGLGLSGAVLGVLVAEGVAVVLAFLPLGEAFRTPPAGSATQVAGMLREAARASLSLLAFWLLVTMDVIFARHYLSPGDAGRYAAAALVGRAVLFLPAGLEVVVYPRFARFGRQARTALGLSLAVVVALGAGASLGIAVFPWALTVALGPAYQGAVAVAPLLGLAMTGFGAVSMFLYYRMAQGRAPLGRLWSAIVLEVAALTVFHASPVALAFVVLTTAWILAAALWPLRQGPTRTALPPPMETWPEARTAARHP
ncbi:MAG: hypothetical protein ACRDVM_03260, partial [Acidimicrobiia bacterium]